jgi:hypothetical protein
MVARSAAKGKPAEAAALYPFGPAYARKIAREHGIPPGLSASSWGRLSPRVDGRGYGSLVGCGL